MRTDADRCSGPIRFFFPRHNSFYWGEANVSLLFGLSSKVERLLQRKWLMAALLIALVVETTLLLVLFTMLEGWFLRNQAFPSVSFSPTMQPQCYTLNAMEAARNTENRTMVFDCYGKSGIGPALKVKSATIFPQGPATYLTQYSEVAPSFTLPPGYVEFSLTSFESCNQTTIPLISGQRITVTDDHFYSYCAIISNSVGKVNGFTIRWYDQP